MDFKTLLAYSPLHTVKGGAKYPPLLIVTADHDDRVAPAHAYKFAATMQDKAPDREDYLLMKRSSGHGEHLVSKNLDDSANTIAFFNDKLVGHVQELPKSSV
jgi:prolyl oligopeptidase